MTIPFLGMFISAAVVAFFSMVFSALTKETKFNERVFEYIFTMSLGQMWVAFVGLHIIGYWESSANFIFGYTFFVLFVAGLYHSSDIRSLSNA